MRLTLIIFIILLLSLWSRSEPFSNESYCRPTVAYLINLTKNKHRLDTFLEMYSNSSLSSTLPLQRMEAVDGSRLTYDYLKTIVSPKVLDGIKYIDKNYKRQKLEQLTRGMIGCFMSHIEIYKKCLKEGTDCVVVFEDDADFKDDIALYMYNPNNYPDDWDIMLLGTVKIFEESNKPIHKMFKFWGTQGYIINKRGMQKMLDNSFPITHQIDHVMGELSTRNKLNVYRFNKNLVTQYPHVTDIQMDVSEDE